VCACPRRLDSRGNLTLVGSHLGTTQMLTAQIDCDHSGRLIHTQSRIQGFFKGPQNARLERRINEKLGNVNTCHECLPDQASHHRLDQMYINCRYRTPQTWSLRHTLPSDCQHLCLHAGWQTPICSRHRLLYRMSSSTNSKSKKKCD